MKGEVNRGDYGRCVREKDRDVRSMGRMREKGEKVVVLVKLRDEKNKKKIFEKRRKLKRTWDVRVKDLTMEEKRNTWRM